MSGFIRVYIEKAKAALGVRTDEQLAGKLGLSKQAIANWRRRGEIPSAIELRFVDAFGSDFAVSDAVKRLATTRENEVVYAGALYVFEKYLRALPAAPSASEWRALGYLFPEIEQALRQRVKQIGFEQETSLTIIEGMMAMIDIGGFPEVSKILGRAR